MNTQVQSNKSPLPSATRDFFAPWVYRLFLRVRPAPIAVFLKKLCGVKRHVIETRRGNFYIDPASNYGLDLLERGEYEPQMIEVFEGILKPGDTFVDVGANEGYLSVLASRLVGASGRVIAVEPQQRLRAVLDKNFQLNDAGNVEQEHFAISNQRGEAELHVSPNTNTGSTGMTQSTRYKVPTESIRTITLSELFSRKGISRADMLKMDIEGFEYEAILGSPELFREHRVRVLALELHPWFMTGRGLNPDDITAFLLDCEYRIDKRFTNLVFVAPTNQV